MNMRGSYNVKSVVRYQHRKTGSHDHCCVPLCCNSSRYNAVLSFHRFPRDYELCQEWLHRIRRESLTVTVGTKVCSRHFVKGDISITKQGKRTLRAGAVPSLFQWNNYTEEQIRPGVWELSASPEESDPEESEDSLQQIEDNAALAVVLDHGYCLSNKQNDSNNQLHTRLLQDPSGLQRFAGSPEDIQFYTRFTSYEHLMAFWTLIEPARSMMVRATRARGTFSSAVRDEAFSRPRKLAPIDEFFLFLNYLSTGCNLMELGYRFNIHHTMVCRVITSWADFLFCLLGSVCIWMKQEKIEAHLPCEFRDFADTEVIVDCIELHCQTPSSQPPAVSFKSHCTLKAMVGMAPHGAVTFVSAVCEGSVTDEEIFRKSGILPLLSPHMAVMVERGFYVDDHVPGKVHRLAFLPQGNPLSVDVFANLSITRLRVHVARLFKRVREIKLFDTDIPFPISGSINELFTVACLLTNYQNGPMV
ncbi:uncharacterized protein LOC131981439 [Centropristis striata]|uniref:uncharacterized protein LOC131981439 n=1 Tax=Centropristis striata TaxID=184440 RepID=UPI0027E12CB0|nr:uncharacterized protein LOC131981439 [Centropristis striata]